MKNQIKISNTIKPFNKNIEIEGDKSLSIRWALLASQAEGISKSLNLLKSEDVLSTLTCLRKLGVKVKYFNEKKPLGTAGPISKIKNKIKKNDYFFLINGDVYTEMNYKKMMTFAKNGKYDLVVGYIKKKYKNSYGVLDIKNDKIKNINEKPDSLFNISSGIYIHIVFL